MQKLTYREVSFCHLGESTEESLGREETALTTIFSGPIQCPGDDQVEQAVIDAGQGVHLRARIFPSTSFIARTHDSGKEL